MAVLGFATVQLRPFPVRTQRRTLEPDGIAFATSREAGDGSGGNVLVTIRADNNEFFYVLRAWTARVTASSSPGQLIAVYNPEWIDDAAAFTISFNVEAQVSMVAHGGNFRPASAGVADVLLAGQHLPLGKISPLTAATQNLMLFNFETNVNAGAYDTVVYFFAYRKEALTVPGFLEALASPGLVR